MTIDEISNWLGLVLEVDETQYPTDLRIMNINEALELLSRRYETRLNEGVNDQLWRADTGDIAVSSISGTLELVPEIVRQNIWVNPDEDDFYPLVGGSYQELISEYADTAGEPKG